jgi:hypothetical protein
MLCCAMLRHVELCGAMQEKESILGYKGMLCDLRYAMWCFAVVMRGAVVLCCDDVVMCGAVWCCVVLCDAVNGIYPQVRLGQSG